MLDTGRADKDQTRCRCRSMCGCIESYSADTLDSPLGSDEETTTAFRISGVDAAMLQTTHTAVEKTQARMMRVSSRNHFRKRRGVTRPSPLMTRCADDMRHQNRRARPRCGNYHCSCPMVRLVACRMLVEDRTHLCCARILSVRKTPGVVERVCKLELGVTSFRDRARTWLPIRTPSWEAPAA